MGCCEAYTKYRRAIPLHCTCFWRKTEFLIWIVRLGSKLYPVRKRTRCFPNDYTIH